jgi:hypothetical protein
MHNPISMAMIDRLQDLLDAVRCVRFGVEFSGYDVLEEFAAGDSVFFLPYLVFIKCDLILTGQRQDNENFPLEWSRGGGLKVKS